MACCVVSHAYACDHVCLLHISNVSHKPWIPWTCLWSAPGLYSWYLWRSKTSDWLYCLCWPFSCSLVRLDIRLWEYTGACKQNIKYTGCENWLQLAYVREPRIVLNLFFWFHYRKSAIVNCSFFIAWLRAIYAVAAPLSYYFSKIKKINWLVRSWHVWLAQLLNFVKTPPCQTMVFSHVLKKFPMLFLRIREVNF